MPFSDVVARFRSEFGGEPDVVALAPGRVNLIGEHTDYNDGFVFPAAIDRGLWVAARQTDGPSRVLSTQLGSAQDFDVNATSPLSVDDWAKYPAGMGWAIRTHLQTNLPNVEAVVDSTVPIGSGVSSSAAIELGFGVVWRQLANLALDAKLLALLGQVCENRFVGVNSGIMDQMASAMGKKGQAMFLDTRTLEIEYAPVPSGTSLVICDTQKPRALSDSAYNQRRSECETACEILGVTKLRDANLDQVAEAKSQMTDVVFRRARHVVSENERCVQFKAALQRGDLATAGVLIRESHVSLRDDYEVSCYELDVMADAAAAAPGVIGARMMGAGFGGACIALVDTANITDFVGETLRSYRAQTGREGEAIACEIVEGARVVSE